MTRYNLIITLSLLLSSYYAFASPTDSVFFEKNSWTCDSSIRYLNQNDLGHPDVFPYYKRFGVFISGKTDVGDYCEDAATPRMWANDEGVDEYYNRKPTGIALHTIGPSASTIDERTGLTFKKELNAFARILGDRLELDSEVNAYGGNALALNNFSLVDTIYFERDDSDLSQDAYINFNICASYTTEINTPLQNGAYYTVNFYPRNTTIWEGVYDDNMDSLTEYDNGIKAHYFKESDDECIKGKLKISGKRAVFSVRIYGYNRGTQGRSYQYLPKLEKNGVIYQRQGNLKIYHDIARPIFTTGLSNQPLTGIKCYSSSGQFPGCEPCAYQADAYGNTNHAFIGINAAAVAAINRAFQEPDVNQNDREYVGSIYEVCPDLTGKTKYGYTYTRYKGEVEYLSFLKLLPSTTSSYILPVKGAAAYWHTHPQGWWINTNDNFSDADFDFVKNKQRPLYLGLPSTHKIKVLKPDATSKDDHDCISHNNC